ncbi:MAG: SRPBCC domain-containing protein [Nitrospirota bacterium]|nr:SRPBCC domain-containing protein [Nitrospirota bacterium]
MNTKNTETATASILLERTFNASRERVFQAWTEADQIKQWFGPEGVVVNAAEVDFRVGGAFRIEMIISEDEMVVHSGEYQEITPPSRLVYSWLLDGQTCGGSEGQYGETQVTVEFEECDGGTLVRLRHEGLPSEQARKGHEYGWKGCLDKLVSHLA